MTKLRSLWSGELPLGKAFWIWAISVGLVVNLVTTVLFLIMITLDRPWAALFFGYAPSVPYNALATVGVWRSAARYCRLHGFRTSFRTWTQEQTNFPRELAEASLAHKVGDAVERAYARSDLFEKRRKLMEGWANYLGTNRGEVVSTVAHHLAGASRTHQN